MKIKITMPKMRPEMASGVLCAWLKEEGERVEKGEALFEVETDKVVSQVEAEQSGTVTKLYCEEGDDVAVETVVAEMETDENA